MSEAFSRLLQTLRLQRDAFVWMDFNDRATADALIFVIATRFLLLLGEGWTILGLTTSGLGGLTILFYAMLNAIVFWLAYAGLAYAVARFFFQASGKYAIYLRIVGFGYPTLLLLIFTGRLGLPALVGFLLGAVWLFAIVTRGIQYESDLPQEKAALAAFGGMVAWIIVAQILGRGLV